MNSSTFPFRKRSSPFGGGFNHAAVIVGPGFVHSPRVIFRPGINSIGPTEMGRAAERERWGEENEALLSRQINVNYGPRLLTSLINTEFADRRNSCC